MKVSKSITAASLFLIASTAEIFAAGRPVLFDIDAAPISDDGIQISWKIPEWTSGERPTGIFIFRDTKPVEDIRGMIPVATLPMSTETYTDKPGDFREYFYAALVTTNPSIETQLLVSGLYYYDQELDALPADEKGLLIPGINSTQNGTRVQGSVHTAENLENMQRERLIQDEEEKSYSGGALREKPLPYMDFPGSLPQSKEGHSLIDENIAMLTSEKNVAPKKVLDIYIFPEDRSTKKETVPTKDLIKMDFAKAEKTLTSFIAKKKSGSPEYNRAKFYLAECHYFNGNFVAATKEFALLQDIFPKQCQEWSKSSLEMMSVGN